jgi:RNA polymerase sigma factor (sigma-70 family)
MLFMAGHETVSDDVKMDLLRKAKDGCTESQHALYLVYENLPKKVVADFIKKAPKLTGYADDLFGEAQLVLYSSLTDYDPERGLNMTSYYYQRIRYGLMDYTHGDLHNGIRLPVYVYKIKDPAERTILNPVSEEALSGVSYKEDEYHDPRVPLNFESLNQWQRTKILKMVKWVLDDFQQQIFFHYFGFMHYKGKSVEEVANILNTTTADVNKHLGIIIKKFRNRFSRQCQFCDRQFYARVFAKYCSNACKRRFSDSLKRYTVKCKMCKKEFAASRQKDKKYCSDDCRREGRLLLSKDRPPQFVICQNPNCGGRFPKRTSNRNNYCCHRCYSDDLARKIGLRAKPSLICQNVTCAKEFRTKSGKAKYCSYACCVADRSNGNTKRSAQRSDGKLGKCKRPECGKEFVLRYTGKNVYCSQECYFQVLKVSQIPRRKKVIKTAICAVESCENVFVFKNRRKYCSDACRTIATAKEKRMHKCNNPSCEQIFVHRSGVETSNRYCSQKCNIEHRKVKFNQKLAKQMHLHGSLRVPSS